MLYAAPNRLTRHRLAKLDLPRSDSMRAPGDAIGLLALLHLFNVAKLVKRGPVFTSAALVAAAVIVQVTLGIWTLLSVAALPLALLHQATGMVTLTLAVIHAAHAIPLKVSARSQRSP